MTQIAAYLALFVTAFGAATILPLGSEAALVALIYAEQQWLFPVIVATVGNYLGACTTYWLGRSAAQSVEQRRHVTLDDTRAGRILKAYGAPVLALSWVPLLGDAIVALSGSAGIPFRIFSVWTIVGKLGRYLVIAWIASAGLS